MMGREGIEGGYFCSPGDKGSDPYCNSGKQDRQKHGFIGLQEESAWLRN